MANAAVSTEVTIDPDQTEGAAAPAVPAGQVVQVPITVDNTAIDFSVRTGGEGPAFFCLGVRKSGSTMLHRIMNFLANRNHVNVVDVPSTFFRNGFTVAHWQAIDLSPLLAPANCYIGFRTFPDTLAQTSAYRDGLKVFMFRDPRDALVSQYFSDAYSHDLPKQESEGRDLFLKKREEAQQADIDAWVLDKVGGIRRTLLSYKDALSDPTCLVLRYEDYVFQKRRMIMKIMNHFGWSTEPGRINKLLADVDVVPEGEDKSRFVRKVIPGDHVAKLKPETVRRLNKKLAEIMELYDYY